MPRQEHVISVFVASPSDVADERARLEEVVREVNLTWSRELGIRFDLVRWETHAYPGIGESPQAVINDQIPDDYDIFIGIMWCRFGTPSRTGESGTVEEFDRAKARHDSDPASVAVMFYFKDEAVPPSHIDPEQLGEIQRFKEFLGTEGVLYWPFSSLSQFEELLRLHLSRQAQEWSRRGEVGGMLQPEPSDIGRDHEHPQATGPEDEDLGFLDLVDVYEDHFEKLNGITSRLSTGMEELGSTMSKRSEELTGLPRDSQGQVNRDAAKRLIRQAASDMESYSSRLEAELPLFGEHLRTGISALTRAASLSVDFVSDPESRARAQESLESVSTLRATIAETSGSIGGFRDTVAGLPRMTGELNRSKRRLSQLLDQLVHEMTSADQLLREAEAVFGDLVSET